MPSENEEPLLAEFLTDLESELVDFAEGYHTKYGEYPSRTVFEAVLKRAEWEWTAKDLDDAFANPLLLRSLNERGIVPPTTQKDSTTGLTKGQLAVVAALNNSRDTRSDVKKIRDLGITPRMFSGWMHNKRFADYIRDSAENLLENATADAHTALLRKVRSGDSNAIKLFFEMTGRYNPAFENQVNLQSFMSRVIEAIQKHVTNPIILQALAAELQMASVEYNVTDTAHSPVAAKLAPKRRELMF
jgi:hypothetical protein